MPTTITLHDDTEGKSVDVIYAEEPLGLPAAFNFGYPLVNLGEKLGPNDRFELVRKLGWGRYSSVWLARDCETSSYVAMKILTGHATGLHRDGVLRELEILRRLKSQESHHCIQLVTDFEYSGDPDDDGDHICLATELFATDVECIWRDYDRLMPIPLVKRILRDVATGLSEMHAAGCVHTDLKSNNIMCKSPSFTFPDAINSLLVSDPSRKNPPEESLSGTVQSAMSQPLASKLSLDEAVSSRYVLGDVGHAQFVEHRTTSEICPEHYRPPEIIMGGPWDTKVDIWVFGCLVFEFVCGTPLFSRSHPDLPPDWFHITQMIRYLGHPFSVDVIKDYKLADEFLDLETGNIIPNPLIEGDYFPRFFRMKASLRGVEEPDIVGALDLAARCLRLNPHERPTAAELLNTCAWLSEHSKE